MSYNEIRNQVGNPKKTPHWAQLSGETGSVRVIGFIDSLQLVRVLRFNGDTLKLSADRISIVWSATW
jgi:hypothetical protein